MFNSKHDAEQRLAGFLMDDMPVESCKATPSPFPKDWFRMFRQARIEFMESLDDSVQELALLNLPRDDFINLLTAKTMPENLCLKFRRPILYGGEINPENMFIITNFPYGLNLDIFMAEQSGQGEIWYPNPAKKIYVSMNVLSGGDGGNATSDRLAQAFASMSQNRDM
ncbi:MAG: hypothetical protein LBD94_02550 [Rickettsiales bacterium]|jgi:hypothetical protein|nr:hypothetical protein [Rickettsiales bacterium]